MIYGGSPLGSRPLGSGGAGSIFQAINQLIARFTVYVTFIKRFAWKVPVKKFTGYITQRIKIAWRSK